MSQSLVINPGAVRLGASRTLLESPNGLVGCATKDFTGLQKVPTAVLLPFSIFWMLEMRLVKILSQIHIYTLFSNFPREFFSQGLRRKHENPCTEAEFQPQNILHALLLDWAKKNYHSINSCSARKLICEVAIKKIQDARIGWIPLRDDQPSSEINAKFYFSINFAIILES